MKSVSIVTIAFCIFAQSVSQASADDDRIFFVKINEATGLQGQIVETDELKVSTTFGEVSIPIEKIEAVKMGIGSDNSAVIAFVNGDLVTGKIEMSELKLKTNWGKAHINASAIDSISGSQYGSFYSDPNGGWRYSRGSARPIGGNVNRAGSGSR